MGNVPPSALRRPSPPGRCLLIDSNKVPAPRTSKAKRDISRVRSRPFYFRRCMLGNPQCRKANSSNSMIDSLPDELLMEILVHLSADDIYDNARQVCRRWCHLIHSDAFVSAHIHRASSGLLLQMSSCRTIFVTATTQGRIEISKLSCRVKFPIICSCNGLVLCLRKDRFSGNAPFILNPATKCAFDLPRFPVGGAQVMYRFSMAYAAASMSYKVVGTYCESRITHCVILTVGVDKTWRHIEFEGLSPEATWLWMRGPLMTGGFLHWVLKTLVVSLNVETENFTRTPIPALIDGDCWLSTDEYLSLLIPCGGNWSWEVWEMKPKTWEWRKVLPNIDLEALKWKIQQFTSEVIDVLRPVGWVRYPEVLAFFVNGRCRPCIIYNLNTQEIDSCKLFSIDHHDRVVQHRNTLVWSEWC